MITAGGGDIFKFAGDACIVLWPNTDNMNIRVLRAAQCAYTIQTELHECVLADNVTLSVKCGIGIGNVSVLHIGGVLNRMEYLAVGVPLLQAFQAEHHAVSGQIIVSDDAWSCVKDNFKSEEIFSDGYVRLMDAKVSEGVVVRARVRVCARVLPTSSYIPYAPLTNSQPDFVVLLPPPLPPHLVSHPPEQS